uniref:Uncharacterized protein n=1 Tax=viral metagenome TaxID=1070528 RepID=A0A6H1ZZM4_9ZZZZ
MRSKKELALAIAEVDAQLEELRDLVRRKKIEIDSLKTERNTLIWVFAGSQRADAKKEESDGLSK